MSTDIDLLELLIQVGPILALLAVTYWLDWPHSRP
jgi:hypothetical protein